MSERRIAYRYRLKPTSGQEHLFVLFAGHCRYVYNQLLERSRTAYAADAEFSLGKIGICYEVAKLKSDTEWLGECHSQVLQQAGTRLSHAYRNFFEHRAAPPRFKSKRTSRRSFCYPQDVRVDDDTVYLPKIGWVKFINSRDPIGKIKTATVTQSATGHWYVSLSCVNEVETLPAIERVVGVDVGLISYVATSSRPSVCEPFDVRDKIAAPKHLRRSQRKTTRLSRRLARKKKGSSNRTKARVKLAKHHEHVGNQRKDFQHKLSTTLVRENQAIGIETLGVNGLSRGRLAKSFHDAAFGKFFRQLEYKCDWYGRALLKHDRFYPSSKECNRCKHVNRHLKRSDREWTCACCGSIRDRDHNASDNLCPVAAGFAETLNACGVDVRPSETVGSLL